MQFHSIAYDFFRPEHRARVRDAELAAAVRSAAHTNAAPRLPVTRPCRELRRSAPTRPG